MSNSIKYNTDSETLALNTGDFWIGTGDVGKGDTVSTGFWNAINPPIAGGGYTIYSNKADEGPSIYVASDDAELITLTNGISGNSYSTVNDCFNYFIGQSDKFVLNSYICPIITEELKFYSDASLVPSYPKNGTSWYDLSGGGNNGTLTNGPTFNSNGYLVFDGVDDYVRANGVGISNYSEAFSMGVWFKVDSTATWDNGYRSNIYSIAGSYNGQYGLFKFSTGDDLQLGVQLRDINSTIFATVSGNSKGIWYNLVSTWDGSSTLKLYLNGELVDTDTTGGIIDTPDTPDLYIAGKRSFGGGEGNVFEGDIAICNYYKKELSSNEVLQNYYQSKIVTDGLVFAVDPGNLVSYEEGSTTTYSLVGTDTGTLTSGVAFNSGVGGVWEFDGSTGYIAVSNLGLSSHTIEGWINSSDASQGSDPTSAATLVTVIGEYDAAGGAKYTYIGFSAPNILTFRIDNGDDESHKKVADVSYTADTWYHVALTYNTSTGSTRAYLNGSDIGGINFTEGLTFDSIPFNISQNDFNENIFDGLVGPVRAYDRALTAAEVAQNYAAQSALFQPPAIP